MQLDKKFNGMTSLLNSKYNKELINAWADAIKFHCRSVADEKVDAVPAMGEDGTVRTWAERQTIVCEQALAILMICGADHTQPVQNPDCQAIKQVCHEKR
jgi:hypothetical protein